MRGRLGLFIVLAGALIAPGALAQPLEQAPTETQGERPDEAPLPAEEPEGLIAPSAEEEEPLDEGAVEEGEEEGDDEEEDEEEEDEPRTPSIRYFLESIEVRGNSRTRGSAVRGFVPLRRGDVLDVDDPEIEAIRWRLLGTGWFREVRLRLRRGQERGWVVLVIEVEERNTIVIQQITGGLTESVSRTEDTSTDVRPYVGLAAAETNFLGLGIGVSAALVLSEAQQGFRARYSDPMFRGSPFGFDLTAFYNNGLEFFGDDDTLVSIVCHEPDPADCRPEIVARNAVVVYKRYGLSLGTGRDIGASTRYSLSWQGELVDVRARPDAASERRGIGTFSEVVPIDFSIDDGTSVVSVLSGGLTYDRRDDPALPSQGVLVNFSADLGSRVFFGDYDFLRAQIVARTWFPMPWGHVLRFGAFAGAIFGRAPFFYKFYVSDLSDLVPSRVLELNLDRRTPPDLFGTAIAEMRSEELAARLDLEYAIPFYRGAGAVRAFDAYLGVGVYALADRRDLRVAVPGYDGLARLPIDLTFDVGARIDTEIGVFQLGFSNLLGFITP